MVRKSHFDRYTGSTLVNVGQSVTMAYGTIPDRWVLVVLGDDKEEHYLNVAEEVWAAHDVGDVIDANDPIIEVD